MCIPIIGSPTFDGRFLSYFRVTESPLSLSIPAIVVQPRSEIWNERNQAAQLHSFPLGLNRLLGRPGAIRLSRRRPAEQAKPDFAIQVVMNENVARSKIRQSKHCIYHVNPIRIHKASLIDARCVLMYKEPSFRLRVSHTEPYFRFPCRAGSLPAPATESGESSLSQIPKT